MLIKGAGRVAAYKGVTRNRSSNRVRRKMEFKPIAMSHIVLGARILYHNAILSVIYILFLP